MHPGPQIVTGYPIQEKKNNKQSPTFDVITIQIFIIVVIITLIGILTTAIIMFEEPSVIEQSSLRGDSTLMHPSTIPMHLLLNWVDHHQYHHDDDDHHHHIINIIIKMMIIIIIIVIINIITIPQPPGLGKGCIFFLIRSINYFASSFYKDISTCIFILIGCITSITLQFESFYTDISAISISVYEQS